jgi:hypothetical protein
VTAWEERRLYVRRVIDIYVSLPGTPPRAGRRDRALAVTLHARGTSLEVVRAALLLATARRAFRASTAPPLPAVRTLFYFLPAIDEVVESPPEPGYTDYLEGRLRPFIDRKARDGDLGVQIPSVPRAR